MDVGDIKEAAKAAPKAGSPKATAPLQAGVLVRVQVRENASPAELCICQSKHRDNAIHMVATMKRIQSADVKHVAGLDLVQLTNRWI